MTIRIVIVDDHRLFADGLAAALGSLPDLTVIGVFDSAESFHDALADGLEPDVLLLDLEMPGKSGLDVLAASPTTPYESIVVTMHTGEAERKQAIALGASGFLSKSTPLRQMAAAVRAVRAGHQILSMTTQRDVLDGYLNPELDPGAQSLTRRERELLRLLAGGVTATDELAERLYISQKTVKNHLANIYEKLAVADRAQAAVEAIRLGFRDI